jgi:hypothetical protein
LALRKSHPGLQNNFEIQFHDSPSGTLCFSRGAGLLVYTNTTDSEVKLNINPSLDILISSDSNAKIDNSQLILPANTTVWLAPTGSN